MAVTPDGNYVYVTNHYGDTVSVIGGKDLYATGDFGSLPVGPMAAGISALLAWRKRRKQASAR